MADLPAEQSALEVVAGMTAAAAARYWALRGAYLRSDNTAMNDEIARKLVECHRAVADQYIGAVLLHTPGEADGRWPSDAVARVLEEFQSKALEDGLSMEVVNSRGATSRGIFDGGRQEKELAEQWAYRARQLPEKWRRAKRLCRRIADMWEQMADEFDVEAAKRRLNS